MREEKLSEKKKERQNLETSTCDRGEKEQSTLPRLLNTKP